MGATYKHRATFNFRGRSYKLFARGNSTLSFRLQHGGKRYLISTGTGDVTLAKSVAKGKIAEILDGQFEPPKRRKIATIGKALDALDKGDRHVREHTLKGYKSSLYRVLQVARGWDKETARKQSLSVLTRELAREFQAKQQDKQSVDYVTPRKGNTWINSALRQARGCFSKKALELYESKEIVVPDSIQGFLSVPALKEVSHRYSDNPIPREAIDRMNEALPDWKKEDERLWAIHLMIRLMGLRNSEIFQARKSWLVKRGGRTWLVIVRRHGNAPKRQDGEVAVPEVLVKWFRSRKHKGDFLIPAKTPTERRELIYKIHSQRIAKFLPGREKTNHELRKWAGSVVATKTNSYERAAEFLRIDIETAKTHYLAFTTPGEPLSLEDL